MIYRQSANGVKLHRRPNEEKRITGLDRQRVLFVQLPMSYGAVADEVCSDQATGEGKKTSTCSFKLILQLFGDRDENAASLMLKASRVVVEKKA